MDLHHIELKEVSELEPLIIEKIGKLEKGLQVLDNQLSIEEYGIPDIFAVDSENSFVLIELKSVKAGSETISQILRYYEWANQNLALIARTFPKIKNISVIRLFIIAPDFDDGLKRIVRYLELDINLIKYIALENTKTQETDLIFESLELEPIKRSTSSFKSIDDIINYISDNNIAEEFKKCLSELETLNVEVVPFNSGKNNWLELRYDDEEIGYLQTRKKYFNCETYDENEDDYVSYNKLSSYDQWISECSETIIKETKRLNKE